MIKIVNIIFCSLILSANLFGGFASASSGLKSNSIVSHVSKQNIISSTPDDRRKFEKCLRISGGKVISGKKVCLV